MLANEGTFCWAAPSPIQPVPVSNRNIDSLGGSSGSLLFLCVNCLPVPFVSAAAPRFSSSVFIVLAHLGSGIQFGR